MCRARATCPSLVTATSEPFEKHLRLFTSNNKNFNGSVAYHRNAQRANNLLKTEACLPSHWSRDGWTFGQMVSRHKSSTTVSISWEPIYTTGKGFLTHKDLLLFWRKTHQSFEPWHVDGDPVDFGCFCVAPVTTSIYICSTVQLEGIETFNSGSQSKKHQNSIKVSVWNHWEKWQIWTSRSSVWENIMKQGG